MKKVLHLFQTGSGKWMAIATENTTEIFPASRILPRFTAYRWGRPYRKRFSPRPDIYQNPALRLAEKR